MSSDHALPRDLVFYVKPSSSHPTNKLLQRVVVPLNPGILSSITEILTQDCKVEKLPKTFTKAREAHHGNKEEQHAHGENQHGHGHNEWWRGRKFDEAPRQSLNAFLERTQMDFHRIQERRMSQGYLKEMIREGQRGTHGLVLFT